MGRQIFLVDGVELGSRLIPNFRDFPGIGKAEERSYCYFCNRCGKIWGELRHDGAQWTTLICRPCARHGNGHLFLDFPCGAPLGIASDWPKEVLLREFLLALERAES